MPVRRTLARSLLLGAVLLGAQPFVDAIDDVKVRPLGDVAIVTGRSVLTGSYRGERMTVTQRFTDVFVRRDGRWVVVASQGTQVAP